MKKGGNMGYIATVILKKDEQMERRLKSRRYCAECGAEMRGSTCFHCEDAGQFAAQVRFDRLYDGR